MLIEAEPESNPVFDWFKSAREARDNGPSQIDTDTLDAAIKAVRESGYIEESRNIALGWIDEAQESLSGLPNTEERVALETLADLTGGRRS
jgi:geranylgeranyl pyrophosphate synthase